MTMLALTNLSLRVRTLTGKEIELDIESDYKVGLLLSALPPTFQYVDIFV